MGCGMRLVHSAVLAMLYKSEFEGVCPHHAPGKMTLCKMTHPQVLELAYTKVF